MAIRLWKAKARQRRKTGVYRIEMDFSIASVTVREVSKMEFYFCPSGAATFELPYVGNGVFCGQDKIEFKQEGWGATNAISS